MYLNLFGVLLIVINCYYYNAIPSFVSNLIWSCMATFTLYSAKRKERSFNTIKVTANTFFYPRVQMFIMKLKSKK